nr:galactose-specific lectin nattectin-like [Crassostrea gigas]
MNSEYLLNNTRASWSEAQANCTIKGGKLAEIESPEENNFIMSLVEKVSYETVWLGGTDQEEEGSWIWQTTKEPITYEAWNWAYAYGQPDNARNSDCLCFYRPYGLYWSDGVCWVPCHYICERELFN